MRSVGRPGNSRLETEWFTEERIGGEEARQRGGGSAPDTKSTFSPRDIAN